MEREGPSRRYDLTGPQVTSAASPKIRSEPPVAANAPTVPSPGRAHHPSSVACRAAAHGDSAVSPAVHNHIACAVLGRNAQLIAPWWQMDLESATARRARCRDHVSVRSCLEPCGRAVRRCLRLVGAPARALEPCPERGMWWWRRPPPTRTGRRPPRTPAPAPPPSGTACTKSTRASPAAVARLVHMGCAKGVASFTPDAPPAPVAPGAPVPMRSTRQPAAQASRQA